MSAKSDLAPLTQIPDPHLPLCQTSYFPLYFQPSTRCNVSKTPIECYCVFQIIFKCSSFVLGGTFSTISTILLFNRRVQVRIRNLCHKVGGWGGGKRDFADIMQRSRGGHNNLGLKIGGRGEAEPQVPVLDPRLHFSAKKVPLYTFLLFLDHIAKWRYLRTMG